MRLKTFSALLGLLALAGCSSFPRHQAWEAPGPNSLLLEVTAPGASGQSFQLQTPVLPGAKILGQVRQESRGWVFELQRLEVLGNWSEGWTEGSWTLAGKFLLKTSPAPALEVLETPVMENLQSAGIRLYGTYLTPEASLKALQARWDRITGSTAFLRQGSQDLLNRDLVKRTFFPEVYGWNSAPAPGSRTVYGESVVWNQDYTEQTFPKELWEVRNSGTLLRDFEEGPFLWDLANNFSLFWGQIFPQAVLQSLK